VTALRTITIFSLAEMPPAAPASEPARPATHRWRTLFGLLGRPVLSPIVIPATITLIGVVALFYLAAVTHGDPANTRSGSQAIAGSTTMRRFSKPRGGESSFDRLKS
jgi:hypothetical protein